MIDDISLIELIQSVIGELPVGYEIFYYIIAAFLVIYSFKFTVDFLKIFLNLFIKER